MDKNSTILKYALLTTLIFAAVELLSYSFFVGKKDRLSFSNPELYTFTEKQILMLARIYNNELGWRYDNKTKLGDRSRIGLDSKIQSNYFALVFGDSFTFGTEVEPSETWPYYLEKISKKPILNFGMPGYGIDQILWSLQGKIKNLKSKYVIFGFISDDIRRSQTNYWRFNHHLDRAIPTLTKPVYNWNGSNFELVPNPIQTIEELPNLMEESFILKLMKADPIRSKNNHPSFSFPFSKLLFDGVIWNELLYDPVLSIWEDQEKLRLLKFVLEQMVTTTSSAGVVPIVILFPDVDMLSAYFKNSESVTVASKSFFKICDDLKLKCFFPLEAFNSEHPARSYFLQNGHYKAESNQKMAKVIEGYLNQLEEEGSDNK